MRRSSDFSATVKYGKRSAQPDVIVHVEHASEQDEQGGPRVGLIVGKSVGSAVERHRVARRLRHVARTVLADLDRSDLVVVRALPSSRHVSSARLEQQLRCGLGRSVRRTGTDR